MAEKKMLKVYAQGVWGAVINALPSSASPLICHEVRNTDRCHTSIVSSIES